MITNPLAWKLRVATFSNTILPMTQERFIKLLDNPALLAIISYEELKTLAIAYPYAHNLRTLLAIKAQQTNHHEAGRTLAAAAAYGLDRTRLLVLVAPKILAPQRIAVIKEEVLELKPIETVQRELEALSPVTREERPAPTRSFLTVPPPVTNEPVPTPAAEVALDFSQMPPLSVPPPVVDLPPPLAPQPFGVWLGQFQLPTLEPRREPLPVAPLPAPALPAPKPEPTPRTGVAYTLAERSVAENKDVLSETLAKLYAQQGHREKAIKMYERLTLAFPEKSGYFAAEINKLKN